MVHVVAVADDADAPSAGVPNPRKTDDGDFGEAKAEADSGGGTTAAERC